MTGLITNPKVVQDALQSKKGSITGSPDHGKKKTNSKNNKKPRSKDEAKQGSNSTSGSKKHSPINSQAKSSQPTTGDSSTEDLRRALFGDLFPSGNANGSGSKESGKSTPKKSHKNSSSSNPHTPKNKDKERNYSTKPVSAPQSAGNLFAGSSFSSSPAASSLPKPSFKGKSTCSPEQQNAVTQQSPVVSSSSSSSSPPPPPPPPPHSTFSFPGAPAYGYPGPPPIYAGSAGNPIFTNQQYPMTGGYGYYPSAPIPPFNGYNPSVPIAVPSQATAAGPSLFDHFMMSDRLEKQSRGVQP